MSDHIYLGLANFFLISQFASRFSPVSLPFYIRFPPHPVHPWLGSEVTTAQPAPIPLYFLCLILRFFKFFVCLFVWWWTLISWRAAPVSVERRDYKVILFGEPLLPSQRKWSRMDEKGGGREAAIFYEKLTDK